MAAVYSGTRRGARGPCALALPAARHPPRSPRLPLLVQVMSGQSGTRRGAPADLFITSIVFLSEIIFHRPRPKPISPGCARGTRQPRKVCPVQLVEGSSYTTVQPGAGRQLAIDPRASLNCHLPRCPAAPALPALPSQRRCRNACCCSLGEPPPRVARCGQKETSPAVTLTLDTVRPDVVGSDALFAPECVPDTYIDDKDALMTVRLPR